MRVRLKEVAAIAGVSEATVSRVLNDRPNVSSRTREVVLDALRQLDAPLPRGALMRAAAQATGRRLVGVLLPDLDNPIFAVMAQLLTSRLAAAGRTALITRSGPVADERLVLGQLVDAGVSAMIVVSGAHADTSADVGHYRRLIDDGTPMVFVNGYRRDLHGAPFVSCDDRHAATLAVQHLVSLGHRRIAFVAGAHRHTVVARKLDGYRTALAAAGITPDDRLIAETMFSAEAGDAAARGLLDAGATAAVAASDLLALGTIRGARAHGRRVPEEWSVIGYDDTDLMAYTDPPLTTVRQPVRAMCHAAADMVLDRLDGRPPRIGEFRFHPALVVRGSTAPRPG